MHTLYMSKKVNINFNCPFYSSHTYCRNIFFISLNWTENIHVLYAFTQQFLPNIFTLHLQLFWINRVYLLYAMCCFIMMVTCGSTVVINNKMLWNRIWIHPSYVRFQSSFQIVFLALLGFFQNFPQNHKKAVIHNAKYARFISTITDLNKH